MQLVAMCVAMERSLAMLRISPFFPSSKPINILQFSGVPKGRAWNTNVARLVQFCDQHKISGILLPMKFRVMGQNSQTGARMTLEFDAPSKAAAEKKASQSGMTVNRVDVVAENVPADSTTRPSRSSAPMLGFILFILIVVVLAWWFYFRSHGLPFLKR